MKYIFCSVLSLFSLFGGAASAALFQQSEIFNPVTVVDGSYAVRTFEIIENGTIGDLNIFLDITSCDDPLNNDGVCLGEGYSFNRELVLSLTSPSGTTVQLVTEDTFDGQEPGGRTTLIFDDEADELVGGDMISGLRVQPIGSLSDFDGESFLGTWSIFIQDTVGFDPKSLNGYRIEISPVPLPAALSFLLMGMAGLGTVSRRRKTRGMTAA